MEARDTKTPGLPLIHGQPGTRCACDLAFMMNSRTDPQHWSSATSYYNADGLGSVTSLTNSSGAAAETYTYDSFGKVTASSGSVTNPFQYTGREMDAETGLYFYRARYYDPAVGRFTAEDPVRSPLRTNLYPYVRNSSPNRIDSSGMTDQPPVPSGAFGKNHGCSLVGISEVTLWTSKSGRVPTSNWTFVTSTQEGAGDYDPVSTITCIWERTYSAELYGHVLTTYTYHCWSNSCFGYNQWTDREFKWSVKDLGQVTGTERTTTTFGGFGAEDETNDILCVTKPLLRPNP
jgi:RHS repeat-associated protein